MTGAASATGRIRSSRGTSTGCPRTSTGVAPGLPAEVARRGRGGKRKSIASTCDLDASGVQGEALERSRLVRVGLRSLRLTENAAVAHRKHPCTLVPALRSNTAFGVPGGLNRIEHAATLSVHKSYLSSYRLTHRRSGLRGPPIRP